LERYLPLQTDTVFSYETERESSGERGLLVLRVNRPRPDMAELIGPKTERLDFRVDAIDYASGGTLLKAPLAVGATWRGRVGTVRVASTDKAISVPAGKFAGCIETVEQAPAAGATITTVFCPEVGIVSIDAQGSIDGEIDRETARLRYFGPAVDLGAER
jgi:hypothetical protein